MLHCVFCCHLSVAGLSLESQRLPFSFSRAADHHRGAKARGLGHRAGVAV